MNAPLSNSRLPQRLPPASGMEIDPRAYARGLSCVHCGLCLPACPTYTQTFNEADSPRGRIQLMLALADGLILPSEPVRQHLDLCLDCRGCETACPSGVIYHELLEEVRTRLVASAKPGAGDKFLRGIFFHLLTHPTRLKIAILPARLLQKVGLYSLLQKSRVLNLLPAPLRKMQQMLPADGPLWPRRMARFTAPAANQNSKHTTSTVAFFSGCIGGVLYDRVNRQAVDLLAACGARVIAAPAQTCCGAIHHHNADRQTAMKLARKNIDALLPRDQAVPDFVTTCVAGCGAMLREYDFLLRDDPVFAPRARLLAGRVQDISQLLLELGLPPMKYPVNEVATYHDACHLAHAQGVTSAPRKLLEQIPGLSLVALPESDICCGAAGTYNLSQPEMSTQLAARKLANVESTGAAVCVTGNIGCALQIQSQASARGCRVQVAHPVELLHRAVFGPPH